MFGKMAKRILTSDWKTTIVGIGLLTIIGISAYKDPSILQNVEIQGLITAAVGLLLAGDSRNKKV
jgi:hypothetical protein